MKGASIHGSSIRGGGAAAAWRWAAKATSMKWFIGPALASVALLCGFLCCHLAGFREYTSILCGTLPGTPLAAVLGVAYVGAWLLAIVVAPILAIWALLGWLSSLVIGRMTSIRRQRDVIDS